MVVGPWVVAVAVVDAEDLKAVIKKEVTSKAKCSENPVFNASKKRCKLPN